jgi:uncharacterized membrane protein YczE
VSRAVDVADESGSSLGNPALSTSARVGRLAASYLLIAIGVALLVRAEVGVSPFDVLNTGLSETLDVPFSIAFLMTSVVFSGTGAALGGHVGWGSLIGTIVIAPLVEIALAATPETEALSARIPLFAGGVLVLAIAICLVISTELGAGPGEVFMLGLIARGVPVASARWVTDGIAFLIGLALGGALGVGTVVFALAFGPLVANGLRLLRYTPPTVVAETIVAP